jgi:hypothetical protein
MFDDKNTFVKSPLTMLHDKNTSGKSTTTMDQGIPFNIPFV